MPYMYILECADGSYYTGSTWNLEKRLWEHQNGQGANHTAKHLPVKLVYCEEGDGIEAAYQREKQIQGWSRKKKQALIAGHTNALHHFAQCQNESHSRNAPFDSAQGAGKHRWLSPSASGVEASDAKGSNATPSDDSQPTFPERSRGEGMAVAEIQAGIKALEGMLT